MGKGGACCGGEKVVPETYEFKEDEDFPQPSGPGKRGPFTPSGLKWRKGTGTVPPEGSERIESGELLKCLVVDKKLEFTADEFKAFDIKGHIVKFTTVKLKSIVFEDQKPEEWYQPGFNQEDRKAMLERFNKMILKFRTSAGCLQTAADGALAPTIILSGSPMVGYKYKTKSQKLEDFVQKEDVQEMKDVTPEEFFAANMAEFGAADDAAFEAMFGDESLKRMHRIHYNATHKFGNANQEGGCVLL